MITKIKMRLTRLCRQGSGRLAATADMSPQLSSVIECVTEEFKHAMEEKGEESMVWAAVVVYCQRLRDS